MNVLGALLRKELRIELRTLESVPGMSLFAVTTFIVFHFGLDRDTLAVLRVLRPRRDAQVVIAEICLDVVVRVDRWKVDPRAVTRRARPAWLARSPRSSW